ncbi:PRCP (predicted) [Pycnogonum litorale]
MGSKLRAANNFVFLALFVLNIRECSGYEYETLEFEQPVDQFAFSTNDTFKQRYLLSTKHWDSENSGPIFFYVGNEGHIEVFANNTGFMWEIAPEFKAMVVFAEHRFYGKSFPYPQEEKKFGLLTSEQAIADHARLITHLKKSIEGAADSPVIGFGGSYGGMLASWMRIKFPHILDGALASSSPVLQFIGLVPCNAYFKSVTIAYRWGGEECPKVIRRSWDIIKDYSRSDEGLAKLRRLFRLCKPLTDDTMEQFMTWLEEGYGDVAMANYPYPNDFLGPLPAWPVKKMCSFMSDSSVSDDEILSSVFQAISVYYNFSSSQPDCMDLKFAPISSLGADNWYFQACTEMVQPYCSNGIDTMFEVKTYNLTKVIENCEKTYGVRPRPYMAELMYGGRKLYSASNILFSNGEIDPWSGGGIRETINPTVIAIEIKDGAHHIDLRESNVLDPPSVVEARNIEKAWIRVWIEEARRLRKRI